MCDTMVALGRATADGSAILAKNSDRPPNEAQLPVYIPRTRHHEPTVRCTHLEVPQAPETYAVLLSSPFWMWGCEMGANEFGVTIGNEAVFTKEPYAESGLLGMDLMRLALERAETARRAVDVIVDLLAAHGQGGVCVVQGPNLNYHNSFLIADPGDAWVLETAGRYWAAKRISDVYSISNALTIGADFDLASPGLVEHAVEQRWCRSEADFDFARCYSDFLMTRIGTASATRRWRTMDRLGAAAGGIGVRDMMALLRDHGPDGDKPDWAPTRGGSTVCMHAANGLRRRSQSTASLVAHLRPGVPVYWMTATSAPCTGVFKPFYAAPVPAGVGAPTGVYDGASLWWAHERLHRALLEDYPTRLAAYRGERDEIESTTIRQETELYAMQQAQPQEARASAFAAF
ncbi:MAG: C69 family dipeptidase [Anaerolineae bacterium]|nr:C69 family dipeptidase [Anaerolineae bacterium]